jgi:flagellar hook-associated protein 2
MASSALPPITSLGSGSNLDLQGILDQLKANAQQQLKQIQQRQTQVAAQVSAYGAVRAAAQAVQTAAKALSNPETNGAVKTTVTGDGFSAVAQPGAVPTRYSIKVDTLASSQQLRSASTANRAAAIGSGGTIAITLQDGSSTTIAVGADTSLNGIVKAINADDAAGVQASVISDGNGNSYLMLSTRDTGTQAAVTTIAVTGNAQLQALIGYDSAGASAMTEQHAATDATLWVNGLEATSASNTVDGVIDGVTLTLTAVSKDDSGSVTIARDTSAATKAVQGFVTAYNALLTKMDAVSSYDSATDSAGVLGGDGTLRSLQRTLASALRVLTPGDLNTLQDLGISTAPTQTTGADGATVPAGGLLLNLDTLDAKHLYSLSDALKNHAGDAAKILAAVGNQVNTAVERFAGKNGVMDHRTTGLNSLSDSLQESYDHTSTRIDAEITQLRAQFVQLDMFVAQMNSTSSYLTQQFAALSSSNNR